MDEGKLKFLASYTMEQFKELKHSSRIDVLENPNTGKLFFSWGPNQTGPVSKKGVPEVPVISLVRDADGEEFYLLHATGSGPAVVVASF